MSIDKENVQYKGATTIEDIERGNDLEEMGKKALFDGADALDIGDKLDDIEAAIKRSNSFETELGVVGQLRGVLDKMKSGVLGIADVENLLKQVTGLKEGLGNDIKNIRNLERKAKLRDKRIDDILEKSKELMDMLEEKQAQKGLDVDDFGEYIDKLMKDVEKVREQAEKEKKAMEPFILDLQKRLEKIRGYENGMINLLDKIGEELEKQREAIIKDMPGKDTKDMEEPRGKDEKEKEPKEKEPKEKEKGEKGEKEEKDKASGEKVSREEMMQEEFRALATGIVKLLVDWGKTEEATNMLNSFTYNKSEGNKKVEIAASSKGEIDSLKSKNKLKQVEQSTVKLEGQSNLQKVRDLNISNSKQKSNEKSFTK